MGRPALVLGPTSAIVAQWLAEWAAFEPAVVAASASPDLADAADRPHLPVDRRAGPTGADDDDASDAGRRPTPDDPDRAAERQRRRRACSWPVAATATRSSACSTPTAAPSSSGWPRSARSRSSSTSATTCSTSGATSSRRSSRPSRRARPSSGSPPPRPPTSASARRPCTGACSGGGADFEIVTPAVVKDGHLAPYQELALPRPADARRGGAGSRASRSASTTCCATCWTPAFATTPFGAWFATRILRRESADGAPVGWATLERDDPDLARAALRRLWSLGEPAARRRAPARGAPSAARGRRLDRPARRLRPRRPRPEPRARSTRSRASRSGGPCRRSATC